MLQGDPSCAREVSNFNMDAESFWNESSSMVKQCNIIQTINYQDFRNGSQH